MVRSPKNLRGQHEVVKMNVVKKKEGLSLFLAQHECPLYSSTEGPTIHGATWRRFFSQR